MELLETIRPSIIKVVGVGGGGCNAVSHMYSEGISGVDFIVCNTDSQSLEVSNVLNKIQLGKNLTDGLGAGNEPSAGKSAAEESIQEIKEMFSGNTKMVFITAGMGGGTGTGAAPVIASVAKEMGILTVGIVTIPFGFEGRKRKIQAEEGINQLRNHVDSLIIICNEKLREIHGNLKLSEAFAKADNVLTTAAKGIAEIITVTGYVNVDFEDVKTVMKDSGVAIMGIGNAEGENRASKAAEMALNSPLLNDNNIKGANNILLYISSGDNEISMDELTEITDYIQDEAGVDTNIIWGNSTAPELGKSISVILVAAGFDSLRNGEFSINHSEKLKQKKVVGDLDSNKFSEKIENNTDFVVRNEEVKVSNVSLVNSDNNISKATTKYDLSGNKINTDNVSYQNIASEKASVNESPVENNSSELFLFNKHTASPQVDASNDEPQKKTSVERMMRLKEISQKIKSPGGLDEVSSKPAYLRRNIDISPNDDSSNSLFSNSSLSNSESGIRINSGNSFLHGNVD